MGDGVGLSIPRRQSLATHELALIALGFGTTLALLVANNLLRPVFFEVLAVSIIYVGVIFAVRDRTDRFSQRVRLLASFAFVLWYYCAIARIVPALGTRLRDASLLKIDEAMFGHTPAIFCERVATPRLTDLMSLCYVTYHVYLFVAVLFAALVANSASRQLGAYLFTGFALGFVGYLLVPAIGPAFAYSELFQGPITGGIVTRAVAAMVINGSSHYDCFPSMHVMVTCMLLDHDWRHVRRRFWVMAVPSLGVITSTIYLRYHYGVDVVAALLLFLVFRRTFLKAGQREVGLPK